MSKELIAQRVGKINSISSRIASSIKIANNVIMDLLIDEDKLLKLKDKTDEQTYKLALDVYYKLMDDLSLNASQTEAINRLKRCVDSGGMNTSAIRNEIFKAAHGLGLPLPSSMF